MSDAAASTAFAVAAALHLGFQLTVTLVVYPALMDAGDPDDVNPASWQRSHDRHSRRIAHVVVPVYLSLLLAAGLAAGWGPDRWSVSASAAVLALLAATALGAAPLHVRLGRAEAARRPRLLRALRRVDLVRLGLAVLIAVIGGFGLLAATAG